MDNPSHLIFQTENERFAEIVKFEKEGNKEKAYAIVDFSDVNKNPDTMNGYEGGKYNILVTVYPSEDAADLKSYLSNKNHRVLTGEQMKKKGLSQRGLGSNVPALLNDSPFFKDSIPQTSQKSQEKMSARENTICSITIAAVVSDKHLDLFVQTAYVGVKKGNLVTPIAEQAAINTPKASSDTVSKDSIPQASPKSQEKLSDRDTSKNSDRDVFTHAILKTVTKNKNGEDVIKLVALVSIPIKSGEALASIEINTVKDIGAGDELYNLIVTIFDIGERYLRNQFVKHDAKLLHKKETLSQVNPQLLTWLRTINESVSIDMVLQNNGEVKEKFDVEQKISSAKTSIPQIPALFKHKDVVFEETNIDIGGGKFDLTTNFLAEQGTKNYVFDP